jgi:phage shock protein C
MRPRAAKNRVSSIEREVQVKDYDMTDSKLRRQNGIVAGVCGGLGAFFGINPIWFRLLFLLLMIPGGLPGLLPYIVLWIIIPRQ